MHSRVTLPDAIQIENAASESIESQNCHTQIMNAVFMVHNTFV